MRVLTLPAITGALRLYQITADRNILMPQPPVQMDHDKLQDQDGLYFDHIWIADPVQDLTKWSYSTAQMIHANCLFYEITKEQRYLHEAQRIARSAEQHWVRPSDGLISDDSKFAHNSLTRFVRNMSSITIRTGRKPFLRAARSLTEKCRDPYGWYSGRLGSTESSESRNPVE